MNLQPTQAIFESLCRNFRRVPLAAVRPMPGLAPARLFELLFGSLPEAFLFESGQGPDAIARFTLMGSGSARTLRIQDGRAFLSDGHGRTVETTPQDGLALLDFDPGACDIPALPHFTGGWVGFLGYEAGNLFEPLPPPRPDSLNVPDLYFMEVERLLVYDHKEGILKAIVSRPVHGGCGEFERLGRELKIMWESIDRALATAPAARPAIDERMEFPTSNLSRRAYIERVERAKKYIEEGDIYQANLAQRFEARFEGDPFELYCRLRAINPAPFSGYLGFPGGKLVSSSPERLLKVEGDRIETRPIAGTRPRGRDLEADRALSRELLLNEKERAEHLMLVDLERNDLGRLCQAGSVRVDALMFLEQYSHVHHIVSNIEGRLRLGVTVADILAAAFPGGTITGCPKIRCIQIIHELEPTRRGPYSGSFGYIGFNRRMDLNIIIRTILVKDGRAYFHTGAGIVADSQPEREYQETLDKAAAMMQALGALRPAEAT